ncbi:MAG: hypothetical protein O3A29_10200 [Planctomycetota bacterium]|nr:hypothetical protein [Planctomycetota bacterium]
MISGADELKRDLKFMVELGNAKDKKQWENLEATLDTFLPGIESEKPIRIDLLLDDKKLGFRSHFPINDINVFLKENLVAFGINSSRKGRNYWQIKGAGFSGFMRFDNGYVSIAEKADDVPAKASDPAVALAALTAKNFDLAAHVTNTKKDPADLQARRDAFAELRKEFLALLKPLKNEGAEEFALRKLLSEHQFDEVERFVVESEDLIVGWTTDVEKQVAAVDFDLTALVGTSLDLSIQQLAEKRGLFQEMTRSENAIMSVKSNFPIDPMRQSHILATLNQAKPVGEKHIDGIEGLSDSGKAASKKALELFITLLTDGANMGIIDAYAEVTPEDDKKHGLLGGIQLPENGAETIREIFAQFPEMKEGNTVEFDVEMVGDVALHKAHIGFSGIASLEQWLGSDVDVWFATGPKTAWIAEGADAQERLKAAIQLVHGVTTSEETKTDAEDAKTDADADEPKDDAEKPADDQKEEESADSPQEISPVVLDFYLQVKPWIDLNADKSKESTHEKFRELIESSFVADEDVVTFTIARVENRAEAKFRAHQGFMRMIGKVVAEFSAQNLR